MTRSRQRRNPDRHRIERRSPEAGSAYIVALLVLVVLTVMGLGLALITQTEMEVGANERTMQRLFYATDAGVQYMIARTMQDFDCSPIPAGELNLEDQDAPTGFARTQQVTVSPMVPILDPPCDLCTVNNAGGTEEYGAEEYFEIHHAVTSRAVRLVGPSLDEQGRRSISAFVALQPWQKINDCYAYENTPEIADVKL